MGLEELRKEIIGNSEKQASAVISEAKEEAKRIVKQIDGRIESYKKKADEDKKAAIQIMEKTNKAIAASEYNRLIMGKKKEVIDSVFESAKTALSRLDDKKRREYIARLLDKAKSEIELSKVFCSSKDSKYIEGFQHENMGMLGGIIAENRDGTIRVDYEYETILSNIKEISIQEIAKILF